MCILRRYPLSPVIMNCHEVVEEALEAGLHSLSDFEVEYTRLHCQLQSKDEYVSTNSDSIIFNNWLKYRCLVRSENGC
jgi:hypothetical protein